jgi:hypothetical protein
VDPYPEGMNEFLLRKLFPCESISPLIPSFEKVRQGKHKEIPINLIKVWIGESLESRAVNGTNVEGDDKIWRNFVAHPKTNGFLEVFPKQ